MQTDKKKKRADLPVASQHPASSHDQQYILQGLGNCFTQLLISILGAVLHTKPYVKRILHFFNILFLPNNCV